MLLQPINYRGRKSKIASASFTDEGLSFFAGYTNCEHCTQRFKIQIPVTEARIFAETIGAPKQSMKRKFARKVQKWADNDKIQKAAKG